MHAQPGYAVRRAVTSLTAGTWLEPKPIFGGLPRGIQVVGIPQPQSGSSTALPGRPNTQCSTMHQGKTSPSGLGDSEGELLAQQVHKGPSPNPDPLRPERNSGKGGETRYVNHWQTAASQDAIATLSHYPERRLPS